VSCDWYRLSVNKPSRVVPGQAGHNEKDGI